MRPRVQLSLDCEDRCHRCPTRRFLRVFPRKTLTGGKIPRYSTSISSSPPNPVPSMDPFYRSRQYSTPNPVHHSSVSPSSNPSPRSSFQGGGGGGGDSHQSPMLPPFGRTYSSSTPGQGLHRILQSPHDAYGRSSLPNPDTYGRNSLKEENSRGYGNTSMSDSFGSGQGYGGNTGGNEAQNVQPAANFAGGAGPTAKRGSKACVACE